MGEIMRETFIRSSKWLVAIGAVSLVAMAGCKKDEPAAKPAAEANTGDKPTAKPGEKAPVGDDKNPTADKPKTGDPVVAQPVAKPEPVIKGGKGLWGLDMPSNAVGFASVPAIDSLYSTIKGKADAYGLPLPMDKDQALAALQAKLKAKSMDWLDTKKPIHFTIWNPKTNENGVILIPITSKEKLVAALPETKKENVDGNAFELTVDDEVAYLNFIDGYLAVSKEKELFAASKDFATRLSANHTPAGQLDVRVSAVNLRTIFAEELKGMYGQMSGMKDMLKKELKKEMPIPGMGGLDGVIDFYMEIAQTVIDETEAVTFNVQLDDKGNLALPFSLQAKKDGKIAKFVGSMANADLSFIKAAPANSWLLFGGQMDPKAFDGMMDYAADMVGTLLKLSDTEKKQVTTSLTTMTALQDGKTWMAFYADGKFPLAMAGEAGVTDGKAYHKAFDAYMTLLMGKALGMAKEFLPEQFKSMPLDDFGKLVEAVNNISKNLGVSIAAGTSTEGNVTVQKLTVSLDMEMLGKVAGAEQVAEAKKFTDLLGTKIEFAIAYGPKKVGMAMGPNGVKTASEIATGTFKGGADQVVNDFGRGVAMLMHVDVAAAITAFLPIVKEAGAAGELPVFAAGSSAGFAIAASGSTLTFKSYGTLDKFVKSGLDFAKRQGSNDYRGIPEPKRAVAAPAPVKAEAKPVEAAKPAEGGAGAAKTVVP
ncbi:MAG: hypothetical protein ACI9OJ_002580 [Myxococcota bacterium]|jgi:hypothetical protein